MEVKEVVFNKEKNVKLVCYIQKVGGEYLPITKRPAMIVLPGGGYTYCAEKEADPIAFEYLKAGFQTFVLYYTVGADMKWPQPLNDYDQAIDYITEHAEEFAVDLDRICCIGFSAGGHLAAAASSLAKTRPAVTILGYPATKPFMEGIPDVAACVDGHTSPCFIFGTCNDNLVTTDNLIDFTAQLGKFGITFESHIYSYGGHGSSTCDTSVTPIGFTVTRRMGDWVANSIAFIREILGDFSFEGLTQPVAKSHINGDYDEYLNVDCTIGHLFQNEEARKMLEPLMASQPGGAYFTDESLQGTVFGMRLRSCLAFAGLSDEQIDGLNAMLGKIRNN